MEVSIDIDGGILGCRPPCVYHITAVTEHQSSFHILLCDMNDDAAVRSRR